MSLSLSILTKTFLLTFLLPSTTFALFSYKAINSENREQQIYVFYEGLLPCGKPVKVQKISRSEEDPDPEKARYIEPKCLNSLDDLTPGFGVVKYITEETEQPPGFFCAPKQIAVARELSCQLCHVMVLAKNFVDFWLTPPTGMAYILGGLIFTLAFFIMAVSPFLPFLGETPAIVDRAKRMMLNVVWGLLIMLLAWVITNTIIWILGVAEWTGLEGGWWQVNCPIVAPPEFFE